MRQTLQLMILLACMVVNSGCFYYKSVRHDHTAKRQERFYKEMRSSLTYDKYVIVHQGDSMWHVNDMITDFTVENCPPDFKVMYGNLDDVDSLSAFYYHRYKERNRRALRYFQNDEAYVISQVHVYVAENCSLPANVFSIPFSAINRIDNFQQATGRTGWCWFALTMWFGPHSGSQSSSQPGSSSKLKNDVHYSPRNGSR